MKSAVFSAYWTVYSQTRIFLLEGSLRFLISHSCLGTSLLWRDCWVPSSISRRSIQMLPSECVLIHSRPSFWTIFFTVGTRSWLRGNLWRRLKQSRNLLHREELLHSCRFWPFGLKLFSTFDSSVGIAQESNFDITGSIPARRTCGSGVNG